MAKIIDYFKANAENFLYIFIADDAARDVFHGAPVILQKRKNQIAYVENAARKSKYSYKQLRDMIAAQIKEDYGKTAGEVLMDICNGKNVYSLKNKRPAGVGAVGAAPITEIRGSDGKMVNLEDLAKADNSKSGLIAVSDAETRQTIGAWNIDTGEQIAYRDTKSGKWYPGATPADDKNSKNMWGNCASWTSVIMMIIEFLGKIFGVVKAKNMVCYQSDGWYGVTANTTQRTNLSGIVPVAILAVAGYMLITMGGDE